MDNRSQTVWTISSRVKKQCSLVVRLKQLRDFYHNRLHEEKKTSMSESGREEFFGAQLLETEKQLPAALRCLTV